MEKQEIWLLHTNLVCVPSVLNVFVLSSWEVNIQLFILDIFSFPNNVSRLVISLVQRQEFWNYKSTVISKVASKCFDKFSIGKASSIEVWQSDSILLSKSESGKRSLNKRKHKCILHMTHIRNNNSFFEQWWSKFKLLYLLVFSVCLNHIQSSDWQKSCNISNHRNYCSYLFLWNNFVVQRTLEIAKVQSLCKHWSNGSNLIVLCSRATPNNKVFDR